MKKPEAPKSLQQPRQSIPNTVRITDTEIQKAFPDAGPAMVRLKKHEKAQGRPWWWHLLKEDIDSNMLKAGRYEPVAGSFFPPSVFETLQRFHDEKQLFLLVNWWRSLEVLARLDSGGSRHWPAYTVALKPDPAPYQAFLGLKINLLMGDRQIAMSLIPEIKKFRKQWAARNKLYPRANRLGCFDVRTFGVIEVIDRRNWPVGSEKRPDNDEWANVRKAIVAAIKDSASLPS